MTAREPDNEIRLPVFEAFSEEQGAPRCPNCHRVMSNREHEEQGCCNDCYDGTIPWQV